MMRQMKLLAVVLCGVLILAGCTRSAETKEVAREWTMDQEQAVTLADGTTAALWRSGGEQSYQLADGTELLRVYRDSGPDNVDVSGREDLSWDTLSETAQKNILAYYDEQGKVYDLALELEKAYADHQACQAQQTAFASGTIAQTISPLAANDHIITFLTSVMLPAGQGLYEERRLGAVFDKKTGEALSVWSLFDLPEEACKKQLIRLANITDETLAAEMTAALTAERIVLMDESIQITFNKADLPSAETNYILAVDHQDLQGMIKPWAVPCKP